jgi:hypothetical protein
MYVLAAWTAFAVLGLVIVSSFVLLIDAKDKF